MSFLPEAPDPALLPWQLLLAACPFQLAYFSAGQLIPLSFCWLAVDTARILVAPGNTRRVKQQTYLFLVLELGVSGRSLLLVGYMASLLTNAGRLGIWGWAVVIVALLAFAHGQICVT